jgi:hypothetical protein
MGCSVYYGGYGASVRLIVLGGERVRYYILLVRKCGVRVEVVRG